MCSLGWKVANPTPRAGNKFASYDPRSGGIKSRRRGKTRGTVRLVGGNRHLIYLDRSRSGAAASR